MALLLVIPAFPFVIPAPPFAIPAKAGIQCVLHSPSGFPPEPAPSEGGAGNDGIKATPGWHTPSAPADKKTRQATQPPGGFIQWRPALRGPRAQCRRDLRMPRTAKPARPSDSSSSAHSPSVGTAAGAPMVTVTTALAHTAAG